MPQGVEGYAVYSSVSPIGSTADSPLKYHALTGAGMSPNYGLPGQSYENGGAIKLLSQLGAAASKYDSQLVKDPFDFTKDMYSTGGSNSTKTPELDRLNSFLGKYFKRD